VTEAQVETKGTLVKMEKSRGGRLLSSPAITTWMGTVADAAELSMTSETSDEVEHVAASRDTTRYSAAVDASIATSPNAERPQPKRECFDVPIPTGKFKLLEVAKRIGSARKKQKRASGSTIAQVKKKAREMGYGEPQEVPMLSEVRILVSQRYPYGLCAPLVRFAQVLVGAQNFYLTLTLR
jgi:hypothetical protein